MSNSEQGPGGPAPRKRIRLNPRAIAWSFAILAVFILLALRTHHGHPEAAPPDPVQSRQEQQVKALQAQIAGAPADPTPRLRLMDLLLGADRNYDAYDAAREARVRFPESAAVARDLAEAEFRTARRAEACRMLQPLAAVSTSDRLRLAVYLVRMGRRDEAVRRLRALPAHLPGADAALAGDTYLDALDPEDAVAMLRASPAIAEEATAVTESFALALLLTGTYGQAARVLDKARQSGTADAQLLFYDGVALRLSGDRRRRPEAEERLRSAAEAAPQNSEFQYELGRTRAELQDWEGARAALEQATVLAPEVAEAQRDLAETYRKLRLTRLAALAQARFMRTVDDAPAAVRELSPWNRKDPADVDAALLLASSLQACGKNPEAATVLELLRQRDPGRQDVLWAQYRFYRDVHRLNDARECMVTLARELPGDLRVGVVQAELFHTLSEFPEEEKILFRLRDQHPENADRQLALGQFLLYSSQRPDRLLLAEGCFRKAAALPGTGAAAHYGLGSLYATRGRPAEAIPELRRALDTAPYDLDALRALGRAYLETRDSERSADNFRLLRQLEAEKQEQTRLETPVNQFVDLGRTRRALARFLMDTGSLVRATSELEAAEYAHPKDADLHPLLALLYGHTLRFQRMFEEQRALASTSKSVAE